MGLHTGSVKGVVASVILFGLLLFAGHRLVGAADHFDSPPRTDPLVDPTPDLAADIADVYAFYTDDAVVIALTFAGPVPNDRAPTFDRDVLYRINVSNDGDPTNTEFPVEFRFGPGSGGFGLSVTNLPGGREMLGPVETNIEKDGILVRAGNFDDPFVFDLQGFRETRATGELSFDNRRDFFRGQNDTGIVIQFPRSMIQRGNSPLDIWGETRRFGGQI
ncbi:hypothetical protein ACFQRC_10740 [Enterovirga sp. GCM10030262]|uniref:hypothetical protein n=1 Tax=Enterovirga sp. GCM10030262 TaxID=3273391 RepID=UPI00360902D6